MIRVLFSLLSMTGLPRLIMRLMLDSRVPFGLKLLIPAAIVYTIVPWDFDFLGILGRIDDLLVLVASGILFLLLAPRDVLMEASGRPGDAEGRYKPEDGSTVIDGEYRKLDE
ncbi:MAG: hypothetical protein OXC95_02465 [Dehalococcoidia bacterium]|nr:hypothetical protein [Dehalococcoidia bacterium]